MYYVEKSNLLVKREGVDRGVQADPLSLNTTLRFHQIKDGEIKKVTRCLHDTICSHLTSFVLSAL